MKEVVIPMKMKVRKHRTLPIYWHYELQADKCTNILVVYRCLETGCLESWKKTDFLKRKEDTNE